MCKGGRASFRQLDHFFFCPFVPDRNARSDFRLSSAVFQKVQRLVYTLTVRYLAAPVAGEIVRYAFVR